MGRGKVTVVIVEDQRVVRRALTELFSRDEEFDLLACVGDGQQAIDVVLQLKPDVVVMDLGLPVVDGITATAAIKESLPDTKVIVFSDQGRPASGIDGYCDKSSVRELPSLVKEVASGLTPSELKVLTLLLNGAGNRQIAMSMEISTEAVKMHIRHILQKLIEDQRARAAIKALRRGF
jgi:NarL family two-component system response regulator LiaR